MQRIRTTRHGDIIIGNKNDPDGPHSWSDQTHKGDLTIGLLLRGGYVYLPGGDPVDDVQDLEIIRPEAEKQRALTWFMNKDQPVLKESTRRIVHKPDGEYEFDDGTPIEAWEDLLEYYKKAPPKEIADWLSKKIAQKETEQNEEHVALTAAAGFTAGRKSKEPPLMIDGELIIEQ